MRQWLALAASTPLIWAAGAQAQSNAIGAPDVARVAASRAIDLRLSGQQMPERSAPLVRELLINRHVSANAAIGLGLANFYSRKKAGSQWRGGEGVAPRARKPAVTFMLKF